MILESQYNFMRKHRLNILLGSVTINPVRLCTKKHKTAQSGLRPHEIRLLCVSAMQILLFIVECLEEMKELGTARQSYAKYLYVKYDRKKDTI